MKELERVEGHSVSRVGKNRTRRIEGLETSVMSRTGSPHSSPGEETQVEISRAGMMRLDYG